MPKAGQNAFAEVADSKYGREGLGQELPRQVGFWSDAWRYSRIQRAEQRRCIPNWNM